jgi:hypothetical protein
MMVTIPSLTLVMRMGSSTPSSQAAFISPGSARGPAEDTSPALGPAIFRGPAL